MFVFYLYIKVRVKFLRHFKYCKIYTYLYDYLQKKQICKKVSKLGNKKLYYFQKLHYLCNEIARKKQRLKQPLQNLIVTQLYYPCTKNLRQRIIKYY